MSQALLFGYPEKPVPLETRVQRQGSTLLIPENLETIPCTHGMHRFPGKFIPNLPRFLLRAVLGRRKDHTVWDPFCGSGTTLIEAALEGRSFLGLDIDPLAVMIATAKTRPLLEDNLIFLEDYWKDFDYRTCNLDLVPQVPNFSHWFTEQATVELTAIKSACLSLPPELRLFCLVVFSSIVRRVSNADDQTQKTYVSHTLKKTPPKPSELFSIFIGRAIQGSHVYNSPLVPSADVCTRIAHRISHPLPR